MYMQMKIIAKKFNISINYTNLHLPNELIKFVIYLVTTLDMF